MSSCCRGRASHRQWESDQSRSALYLSRPTDLPEFYWLCFSCNGDCSRTAESLPQRTGKEERQSELQHNGRTDGRKNFDHTAWVMTTQRWRSGVRACVFALGVSSVHLPILWVSTLTGNYEATPFHLQRTCLLTVQQSTPWPPHGHATPSPPLPGDGPCRV